jgi:hypothetical protein
LRRNQTRSCMRLDLWGLGQRGVSLRAACIGVQENWVPFPFVSLHFTTESNARLKETPLTSKALFYTPKDFSSLYVTVVIRIIFRSITKILSTGERRQIYVERAGRITSFLDQDQYQDQDQDQIKAISNSQLIRLSRNTLISCYESRWLNLQ